MAPGDHAGGAEPETYPLIMGYLPPKFIRKAERELFESPENIRLKVDKMRELIRKDNGMKNEWFTDENIVMYLRSKKYDAHRTFACLKKMVNFVQKYDQYFQTPDPEVLKQVKESEIFTVLPNRDRDGCVVGVVKLRNWNPSEVNVTDVLRCALYLMTPLLEDPMTQVNGCKIVYDYQCSVMRYIRYCTPYYLYICYQLVLECFPVRVKEFHAVNPSAISKLWMSILNVFCSEKIKNRIQIHNDLADLTQTLQANVVPTSYGGQVPDEEISYSWRNSLNVPNYINHILEDLRSSDGKRGNSH